MREVKELVREREWKVDLHAMSADLHMRPDRIAPAVAERLERLSRDYDEVVVVYGDCGTAGKLDRVLQGFGVRRPAGPHCYAMYADCGSCLHGAASPSYLLTDFMVRAWEVTVARHMGFDVRPELARNSFAGFDRVIYLCQSSDEHLREKAQRIADLVGLPLEIRDVGVGGLGDRIAEVMGEPKR